jgi:hypothetical protein
VHHIANSTYASIANILAHSPERFFAVAEGLAISIADVDDALGDIPRSTAIAAALRDGYLLKATHSYWMLLPVAFDCADEWLPSGVRDCRGMNVREAMAEKIAA